MIPALLAEAVVEVEEAVAVHEMRGIPSHFLFFNGKEKISAVD